MILDLGAIYKFPVLTLILDESVLNAFSGSHQSLCVHCTCTSQNMRRTGLHWALCIMLVKTAAQKEKASGTEFTVNQHCYTSQIIIGFQLTSSLPHPSHEQREMKCNEKDKQATENCAEHAGQVRGVGRSSLVILFPAYNHHRGAAAHFSGIFQLHLF